MFPKVYPDFGKDTSINKIAVYHRNRVCDRRPREYTPHASNIDCARTTKGIPVKLGMHGSDMFPKLCYDFGNDTLVNKRSVYHRNRVRVL